MRARILRRGVLILYVHGRGLGQGGLAVKDPALATAQRAKNATYVVLDRLGVDHDDYIQGNAQALEVLGRIVQGGDLDPAEPVRVLVPRAKIP
jgi:hypothetical protein